MEKYKSLKLVPPTAAWTILLILFSTLTLASPWSDKVKVQVDEAVAQHFRNQSQVGVVVGIIEGNDTHIWSYGERILGSGETPSGDTFFEMGSITKTYTATLFASELLRGAVTLDTKVKTLWPELEGMDAGTLTLEQLATHSSGLPRMPDNFTPKHPENPFADYDESKLFEFIKTFKLEKEGLHAYEYSNIGLGLLGFLLSKKLNDEKYESYLQKNLLSPLGLNDTKVKLESRDLLRAAQGYDNFFGFVPFWDLNILEGAGVLKTTVLDLLKYTLFNIKPDASLLGQAVELAQKPRSNTDDKNVQIGLVWESTKLGGHSVITHSGATGGYRANLVFDKENQIGAVVLSNTNMGQRCILAPVFDVECKLQQWIKVDQENLEKLVGNYRSEKLNMNAKVFIENGMLGLQAEEQPKGRLWAKSDLEFDFPDAGASFNFKQDANGNTTHFVLIQNGEYEFLRK